MGRLQFAATPRNVPPFRCVGSRISAAKRSVCGRRLADLLDLREGEEVHAVDVRLPFAVGVVYADDHPNRDLAKLELLHSSGLRLTARSVQLRLRKFGLEHGSGQNLPPHLLRHSLASHLLESSGDLRAVQELLGHRRINTTQIYTHLNYQHLAQVYDAAHPRARRKADG